MIAYKAMIKGDDRITLPMTNIAAEPRRKLVPAADEAGLLLAGATERNANHIPCIMIKQFPAIAFAAGGNL